MVNGWFPRRNSNTNKNKYDIRFFRLHTLRVATNNFSPSTVLGHGGFGSVFKGVLPENGTTVAIKRSNKPSEGFLEMVELMYHIRHVNLNQVIGCCVENGEQLLVCEYAENGSVWDCLHGENRPVLEWGTRAAVCIGTARGLSYLHEEISPRVIHRDIKSSNILLDTSFVPKIVDFDLIHIVGGKRVATSIAGTVAYLDPSYVLSGELTEKVDVYSFGLFMLEIISGRGAFDLAMIEDRMITGWVRRVRKEGIVLKIVDPKLTDFPKENVERFINVGLLCTRATSEQRPSMFEVVHMLYGRHKSDQEISEMAARAIADQPAQWSTTVSMSSLTISISEEANVRDGCSSAGIDCAAEMRLREEPDEASSSSQVEEKISAEDFVRMYYMRSMEKIMKFHAAVPRASNRTSSKRVNMEAVYPPFLSGEYRTSRVLYSERSAQL